jgi:hypothetical protein
MDAITRLEAKLEPSPADALTKFEMRAAMDALDLEDKLTLAGCTLASSPGKNDNWVEDEGGLPEYICEIARSIMKSGKSKSNAIQIAIGQVKNWASGQGNVNADTRAKAAAAVAQWTKMKASAKAKK